MTDPTPAKRPAKKSSRWTGLLRLTAALVLFSVVLALVPFRDQFTWSERFPGEALVGDLRWSESQGELIFAADQGVRIVLVRAPEDQQDPLIEGTTWATLRIESPQGEVEKVTLDRAQQQALADQPSEGLLTTIRRLRPLPLLVAMLLYIMAASLSFTRWHILLNAVGVRAGFWRAQKLGYVGLFFSNIIPGMTGGDLVKAIYVARDHPDQRATAVLSVLVDRAIGLFGLALVGSGVLWFNLEQFRDIAFLVNGVVVLMVIAACVLFSRRIRKSLRLEKLLARLPMNNLWQTIDRSVLAYRFAGRQVFLSVLLSLVVHTFILSSIGMVGVALNLDVPFYTYYALAPLPLIIQSVPLAPAGIGVGEAAFVYFFTRVTGLVTAPAALALALSYRAVQLGISLIGGALLMFSAESRVSQDEMESDAALPDGPPPQQGSDLASRGPDPSTGTAASQS